MNIQVIAFDADDTLWANEPFFQEIERKYTEILCPYGDAQTISDALFQTEMSNLDRYGYGAKGFTLSMIETALRISKQAISAEVIQDILHLGKSLLNMPIKLLPEVKETLQLLNKNYKLVVATKGDLLDQQRKLQRSGLEAYFKHVEIMSDKTEKEYLTLIASLQVEPKHFLMVGNSMKSDIQPVLNLGGYAIHIPFEVTWQHEVAKTPNEHPQLTTVHTFGEVAKCLTRN